jgi:hypothetical protein
MGMAVICRLDQSQATKLLDFKALQIHVTLRLAKLPFINAPCSVYHYLPGRGARVAWQCSLEQGENP